MKVALIKLGSRISVSSKGTSGGTGEALSIIKMLVKSGVDVDAYTEVLNKDNLENLDFNIYNLEDTYKDINSKHYDALLVMNGNINYFGGNDVPSQTLNYYIINHFEGKVFYILCDCNLLLKQIWPTVSKKSFASNYKEEDLNIVRDDIIYVAQPRNLDLLKSKLAKNDIKINKVIHFPFERFPLVTIENPSYNNIVDNPFYDLSYGGTFRGGKREKDMIKFYFGYSDDIKVEMFGKIKESNFNKDLIKDLRKPEFNKAVSYNDFTKKMSDSLATVIIGDPIYKQLDNLAQRIYESIMTGNITFIDASYDYNKRVFTDKELIDFNYVNSREEVEDRIRKLRNDKEFRVHIINKQIENTKINILDYCNKFKDIIEEER